MTNPPMKSLTLNRLQKSDCRTLNKHLNQKWSATAVMLEITFISVIMSTRIKACAIIFAFLDFLHIFCMRLIAKMAIY